MAVNTTVVPRNTFLTRVKTPFSKGGPGIGVSGGPVPIKTPIDHLPITVHLGRGLFGGGPQRNNSRGVSTA